MEVPAPLSLFDEPTEHVVNEPSWTRLSLLVDDLGVVVERFKLLRDQGVTTPAILAHFLRHRIAPLQQRPHVVWDYEGSSDPSGFSGENMSSPLLRSSVSGIFGAGVSIKRPSRVLPL